MIDSDFHLLRRWSESRDAEAFAQVAKRYANLVYAACWRILGSSDAEDAAQDCFLILAKQPPNGSRPLGPWLHTVATRQALNRLKAKNRRVVREQHYAEGSVQHTEPTWNDVQGHVDHAIAELPEKLRQPVVMHFLEGASHAAIAEKLGLPRTTVSSRISRGIEEIRANLARRGVQVGAAALTTMLLAEGAMAAPASLLGALGKLALAGSHQASAAKAVAVGSSWLATKVIASLAVIAIMGALAVGYHFNFRTVTVEAEQVTSNTVPVEQHLEVPLAPPEEDAVPHEIGPPASPPAEETTAAFGVVIDAGGVPVAGAEVVLGIDKNVVARVTSAADGAIVLDRAVQGSVMLCAYKPDVGLAILASVDGSAGAGEVMLEPMASVSGRILDKDTGAGVPGLRFKLAGFAIQDEPSRRARSVLQTRDPEPEALTDAEGNYIVKNLLPTKYWYTVEPSDTEYVFPGYEGPPKYVTVVHGEQLQGVDLVLSRGGSIVGTVYKPDGKPVEKGSVSLLMERDSYASHGFITLENGRFAYRGLGLDSSYRILASSKDFASKTSEKVQLLAAGEVVVDLRLTPGYPLSGVVKDQLGNPVPGADIAFAGGRGARADSDKMGRFKFEHVEAGDHALSIFHQDPLYQHTSSTFSMPAQPLTDMVLTMHVEDRDGAFVAGRLTSTQGKPLANQRVLGMSGGRTQSGRHYSQEGRTNAEGQFRLDGLGDSTHLTVDAYPDGYAHTRVDGVPAGTEDLELVVTRFVSVRGQVVDAATQAPVQSFEIRHRYQLANSEHSSEWSPVQSTKGEFRLDEVMPPWVEVEVRATGYGPGKTAKVEVEEGAVVEDMVIALETGASIAGVVLDERTGHPVAGARVRVFSPVRYSAELLRPQPDLDELFFRFNKFDTTDEAGKFELQALPPDLEMGLVAWADGFATEIVPGASPGNHNLVVKLAPEGRIAVRVENVGEEAGSLYFQCFSTGEEQALRYNDSGPEPEFNGLASGHYEVVVLANQKHLAVFAVEVRAGDVTEVVADFAAFESNFAGVQGKLEVPAEYGFAHVMVAKAETPEQAYIETQCTEDGTFTLQGVPPGDYVLRARAYAAEEIFEWREPLTLEAGEAPTVHLALVPTQQ